jgi:hypothetical protein
MEPEGPSAEDRRKHVRLQVRLPVRSPLDRDGQGEIELVDISPSGMRIRSERFEPIEQRLDPQRDNRAEIEIHLTARLVWVQIGEGEGILTGWQFERGDQRASRA